MAVSSALRASKNITPINGTDMNPADYRTALATLGLSQLAAGRWLGVSNKTAQRYATTGPSGPAARSIQMLLNMGPMERLVCLTTAFPLAMLEK